MSTEKKAKREKKKLKRYIDSLVQSYQPTGRQTIGKK